MTHLRITLQCHRKHFVSCSNNYFKNQIQQEHDFIMSDSSSSAAASSYIHMVQHLIEECLLFNMSREECMDALAKHANILPVITSTVWKELEKENKKFFEAYTVMNTQEIRSLVKEKSAVTDYELETMKQRIHKMLSDLNSTSNGSTC